MIGFFIIHFFTKTGVWAMNNPKKSQKISLVEFGPGRATLMLDCLRVLDQFGFLNNIEINFIEASPFLQTEQQERLKNWLKAKDIWLKYEKVKAKPLNLKTPEGKEINAGGEKFSECERFTDADKKLTFSWYFTYESFLSHHENRLRKKQMPQTMILCHEFFDALPVMIFEKTEQGWVEKQVDASHETNAAKSFQMINSDVNNQNVLKILNPFKTFAQEIIKSSIQNGDRIEISPRCEFFRVDVSDGAHELVCRTYWKGWGRHTCD